MSETERLVVEDPSVSASVREPYSVIEADASFTVECPNCDDGHTITFHTMQKTVICQGGCRTEWRLRI